MFGNLKEKFVNYKERNFVRNVFTLQVGNFLGSLVQGIAGVLLARFLEPELFGIYALAFGLASFASVFLGAGAQDAVTTVLSQSYVRNDQREGKEALAFLVKVTVILGSVALVAAFFAPVIAEHFYHNRQVGVYASIIILASIFSTSFFSLSSLALQVVGRIKRMTTLILADQITRYGFSVIFVLFGFEVVGAVTGHLVGAVIIFLTSIFIWENLRKNYLFFPSLADLLIYARKVSINKYLGFSFWIAVDRNIATLYLVLPLLLVGIYVSISEVAYFKLAFGYMNLVLSLLGPISILLNVEFPKIQVEDKSKLGRNFVKVTIYSVLLSCLLTSVAVIVAPLFFKYLYGINFLPSIKYVFGLFVYGALFGIGVGLGPMWRAINKVKVSILINLITLGLGIPLGLFLIKNYHLWGAVIMVTAWYTISHLVSFVYLMRKLPTE